ncbi:MAG: glycosyltransferase family 4 protein [Bacteroidia bacterium]
MKKKKILIFIDWYLPGFKAGGPIRSVANLVSNLNNEYEFLIVTRDTDYADEIPYKSIKQNDWNLLPDGTSVYYFSKEQLNTAAIRKLIDEAGADVVYLNGMYSRYFTLVPLRYLRRKKAVKVIVAARGMLSAGSLGVKSTKKRIFLFAAKMSGLFRHVLFHATTTAEEKDIRAVFGNKANVKVAGNLPRKNTKETPAARDKQPGELRLVNVARIAPEKNLLQALLILARVKGKISFDFYGPVYDKAYWKECSEAIRMLPANITASYKGSIESDKVPALLEKAHMLFMPTTGENFGHIILQSLAAGCPVIISDLTPWRQLAEKGIGWDCTIDVDSDDFARVIGIACSMGQQEYDTMSAAAAKYAKEYSDDPSLLRDNTDLFR